MREVGNFDTCGLFGLVIHPYYPGKASTTQHNTTQRNAAYITAKTIQRSMT